MVEEEYHNNYKEMNNQKEYGNDTGSDFLKDNNKKQPSETTEDVKEIKSSRRIRTTISFSRTVLRITALVLY